MTDPPQQKKRLSVGAIIGIVAGAVAALAVLIAVVLVVSSPGREVEDRGRSAADAVEGYLAALAASDAEAALSFVGATPGDATFLTDDMLAASHALAPIADIRVTAPTGQAEFADAMDVPVEYTIGGTPVSVTFPVSDYDDEAGWTVTSGTVELGLGTVLPGLALTLNGQPVAGDTAEVFPGVYQLATTTPRFVLAGQTIVVATVPGLSPDLSALGATLTPEGLGEFRQLVTASVQQCLASTALVAGCGADIAETLGDGTRIVDGTITRRLGAKARATLANLTPQESSGDPLVVRGQAIGALTVTADCETGGQRYTDCTLSLPPLGSPLVDFTTDPATVRWD